MQLNKWDPFLSDPQLREKYRHLLHGKFLFEKICHDALECLKNYLAILLLMDSQEVEVSSDTLEWFSSRKGAVETAVTQIYSIVEIRVELPELSKNWPAIIKSIGSTLGEVQTYADSIQVIDELNQSSEKDLKTMAMANLLGIKAIYLDIQAENYKQLLTTQKYY